MKLLKREPNSFRWRGLLQAAHQRIGDAYRERKDYPAAAREFDEYLKAANETASMLPGNGSALYEVSNAYQKIGDALREAGKLDEALKAYRESLRIAIEINNLSFWNGAWKKILAMDHQRIGMVLGMQGEEQGARDAFQKCLDVPVNKFAWSPRTLWPPDVTDFCRKAIVELYTKPAR